MSLDCVVDASVGIKLFLVEPLSDRADSVFASLEVTPPASLYVPDLFYVECTNILWKYVRRFGHSPEAARQDVVDLVRLPLHVASTADLAEAALALNSIRRRAGHTVDIPLTLENVLRERRVELAFENKRNWDLNRRRIYHSQLHNTVQHALVPVLDLRVDPPQYIFIRQIASREKYRTYLSKEYYRPIPDVSASGLIQNPEW